MDAAARIISARVDSGGRPEKEVEDEEAIHKPANGRSD